MTAPRFFVRKEFESVGGFDETLTGPEDFDLGLRMKKVGRTATTNSEIIHDEGGVGYLAACRKKAYYAPKVLLFLFLRKRKQEAFRQFSSRPWLKKLDFSPTLWELAW